METPPVPLWAVKSPPYDYEQLQVKFKVKVRAEKRKRSCEREFGKRSSISIHIPSTKPPSKRSTDLQHEPLDNPVEPASLIAQLGPTLGGALVTQTEVQKVVGRLGYDVLEELEYDPAGWARVDGDVKVRAGGCVGHDWLM